MSRSPQHSPLGFTAIVETAALGLCGCVPIPNQVRVTPAVVGELRRSDGSTSGHIPIALTGYRDKSCSKPTIYRVTDSVGRFRMPATEQRSSVLMIWQHGPLPDRIPYHLCAGGVDSAGQVIYRSRTEIHGFIGGDSLNCLEWYWYQQVRVTCEPKAGERIVTSGRWTDGTGSGTYRMILADEVWGGGFHPFIQWLETGPTAGSIVVRAIVELPIYSPDVQLIFVHGGWYVTGTTYITGKRVVFRLGPPKHAERL